MTKKIFLGLFIYLFLFLSSTQAQDLLKDCLCLTPNLRFGNLYTQQQIRSFQLKKIKEAGIKYLRVEFFWHNIEKEKGKFDFSFYDKAVNEIVAKNIKIIALLGYGNIWASAASIKKKDIMYPPDNVNDFANYVQKIVKHYKNKINFFEIWNEQNTGFRFWKTSFLGDPKKYGELLKASFRAAKKADKNAIISFGGTFYAPQFILGTLEYTKEVFKYHPHMANFFDTYSFHPYMLYPPISPPESEEKDITGKQQSLFQMIKNTQKILQEISAKDKPLWITENGWSTFNTISELQQAQYLVRSYLISFVLGVKIICWYTFSDSIGHNVKTENYFGLFKINNPEEEITKFSYVKKLSYLALKNLYQILGNFYFSKDLRKKYSLNKNQYLYEFKNKKGKILWVYWTTSNDESFLNLPNNIKPNVNFDILGNRNQVLKKITFLQSPQYLEIR